MYLDDAIRVTVDRADTVELTYRHGGDYTFTVRDRLGNVALQVDMCGETLEDLRAGIDAAKHRRLIEAIGATA